MDRDKSIEMLNKAVADEVQALHQYMYFHFHLDDQGLKPLATMFKRIAIAEMIHAEDLAERILFLGGDVDLAPAGGVERITDPVQMLEWASNAEKQAAIDYNQYALECSANADAASRQVFEALILDEEGHFEQFDLQISAIQRFGPSYLALQSFEGAAAPSEGA